MKVSAIKIQMFRIENEVDSIVLGVAVAHGKSYLSLHTEMKNNTPFAATEISKSQGVLDLLPIKMGYVLRDDDGKTGFIAAFETCNEGAFITVSYEDDPTNAIHLAAIDNHQYSAIKMILSGREVNVA